MWYKLFLRNYYNHISTVIVYYQIYLTQWWFSVWFYLSHILLEQFWHSSLQYFFVLSIHGDFQISSPALQINSGIYFDKTFITIWNIFSSIYVFCSFVIIVLSHLIASKLYHSDRWHLTLENIVKLEEFLSSMTASCQSPVPVNHDEQLVWGVHALVFTRHGAVHYGYMPLFRSHLSKSTLF